MPYCVLGGRLILRLLLKKRALRTLKTRPSGVLRQVEISLAQKRWIALKPLTVQAPFRQSPVSER